MQIKRARAAILAQSRQPLVVDDIALPDALDAGQVLVKVLYTTICGAQINEIDALKGIDKFLPHLLGHEASAEVVEIGPGVTTVNPGDPVVLHWRPSRGIQSRTPAYGWRGQKLNAGWVTTFNEYAVVSENRMTAIAPDFDLKVAPLLGDLLDRKLEMAQARGATHCINGGKIGDVAGAIRAIVGAAGPDKVFETTGVKSVIESAYELTHADGTCVLVGAPQEKVTINTLPIHFNKVLTGSHGGGAMPHIDIPRIIRLVQAGRLSLDGIVTDEFGLDDINPAIDLMRSGNAGRVLIRIADG